MSSVPRFAPFVAIGRLSVIASAAALVGCDRYIEQPTLTSHVHLVADVTTEEDTEVRDRCQQAKASFDAGDYDRAVDGFTWVLRKRPRAGSEITPDVTREDVLFQRGLAYLKMGFPDTAVADFTDVIENRPDDAKALVYRGLARFELNDWYRANNDCTSSIRLEAQNPLAYRTRGLTYLQRGQYERAIADLKQAQRQTAVRNSEIDESIQEAYRRWSEKLASAGRVVEAKKLLAEAAELQPQSPEGSIAEDAEADVAEGFLSAPGPGVPRSVRAKPILSDEDIEVLNDARIRAIDELLERGNTDEALVELTSLIKENPDKAAPYARRAAVWLKLGFADNALLDINDAIRLDHSNAEQYRLKAKVYLAMGDGLGATAAASEAIRHDPANGRNFAVRGTGYLKRDMYDEAVRDLRYALEIDRSLKRDVSPVLAEALYRRGKSLQQAGKTQEAEADMAEALELGWTAEAAESSE